MIIFSNQTPDYETLFPMQNSKEIKLRLMNRTSSNPAIYKAPDNTLNSFKIENNGK